MLQSLIAYARGAGFDARWLVLAGTPEFFLVTKRIHNYLHGSAGDGGALGVARAVVGGAVYQLSGTGDAEAPYRTIERLAVD